MPICALTAQALMVMPDWSLVVTTFSRQSWLLQRTATRVTSMVTFVDKEYPLRSANAGFMPTLVHAVFLDAPYANLPARTHSSVAALFRAGRIPATPVNADCLESR